MRLDDFRLMVERMAREVPPEYLEGIGAVDVSPRTLPHPTLAGVWTLGECIPIDTTTEPVQSRVVLYHGSFSALAREHAGFDWREEAWETLTHELRHHLEWRANAPELEAYDWAADQNFRRHEGEMFDPLFYQAGAAVAPGVTRIEEDVFVERVLSPRAWRSAAGRPLPFEWRGTRYEVDLPRDVPPVVYLHVEAVHDPPPGNLVLVVRRRARPWDLWRHRGHGPLEVPAIARPAPLG